MEQSTPETPEMDEEGKPIKAAKPTVVHAEESRDTYTLVVGSHSAGKSSAIMNFLNPNKGWLKVGFENKIFLTQDSRG